MDGGFIVIPLCVLKPEEYESTVIDQFDMPNGAVTAESWEMQGTPVWGPQCEVCGVVLKDDEVDLCGKCEEQFYE